MAQAKDFERIAMPYLDVVYRVAWSLCQSPNQAEDLTQTTYAKALERFESYTEGTNCRAWLLRILKNTWLDRLRHQKVVGPTAQADERLAEDPADRQPELSWSDAEDLLENFGDQEVIEALAELPPEQRLTLYLADVEQLDHHEVADVLGIAVGTVKSRTSRARSALKERLAEHARELGYMGRMSHDAE